MSPPQQLFNTPEAWARFSTFSWNSVDGVPPKKSNLLVLSPPPASKPKSPLSVELRRKILLQLREHFSEEAWEKYTKFNETYPDGVPPKDDSLSEAPNPHIAGNSRYTHEAQEDGHTIKLTLLINWAPAPASGVRQARSINELQLLIKIEFELDDEGEPTRYLPQWKKMSMTRIAIDELAAKASTSVAASAITGMSGNLERFKTKTFLSGVVVELERRGTSEFKIKDLIKRFWEEVGTQREAMEERCGEYKEATELGEDEGDADDEDESDDEVYEDSDKDEDSEDADEDYEPSRKRRPSDEDDDEEDDDIEPIRKRRKSDDDGAEVKSSAGDDGESDFSDNVIQAPRKGRAQRSKGLQMEVFPDMNQTLCTQVYGYST